MKKLFGAIAFAALLVLGLTVPMMAQGSDTSNGTVQINGTLNPTITTTAVTLDSAILTGRQISTTGSVAENWTAVDATGTGNGWTITVEADPFKDNQEREIPLTNFTIESVTVEEQEGSAAPTISSNLPEPLGGVVTIATASGGAGMGTYELKPTFKLVIPADTYAGEYNSTLTVTIATGP